MNNAAIFIDQFRTDGYGIHLLFARGAKTPAIELDLSDFTIEEIDAFYRPCGLDSGRRHISTASYGCGSESV